MEICLEKTNRVLRVLFSDPELAEKHFEGESFKHVYKCSGGIAFTFEKSAKGLFVHITFDRLKDTWVLYRIFKLRFVEELRVLLELAHLPFAKIFSSNVTSPNGYTAEFVDAVGFKLRKIRDGEWESRGMESADSQLERQTKLQKLRDELPKIYGSAAWGGGGGQKSRHGARVIFLDEVEEVEPGDLHFEASPKEDDSPDPETQADCSGCGQLFPEDVLTEVRPGVWLCHDCEGDLEKFEGSEIGSGALQINPDPQRKKEDEVNAAIMLLLWRCRDAQIHKDTPKGKGGYFGLHDWITKAEDKMIYELGEWCADIQELNIGFRDS